ncbi:MAG: hypothetical protein HYT27_01175 [Parcubacteria group bacterium]|nr:hypothetical protein [Parcubacteria group bacterium]
MAKAAKKKKFIKFITTFEHHDSNLSLSFKLELVIYVAHQVEDDMYKMNFSVWNTQKNYPKLTVKNFFSSIGDMHLFLLSKEFTKLYEKMFQDVYFGFLVGSFPVDDWTNKIREIRTAHFKKPL